MKKICFSFSLALFVAGCAASVFAGQVEVPGSAHLYTTIAGERSPAGVTELPDGGWLVVWTRGYLDVSGFGVYQQRYAASGARIGVETQVNTTTTDAQNPPAVTVLVDGGWLVTWVSYGDGSGFSVYQQRYAACGAKMGVETLVNTDAPGDQLFPAVAALVDGGWIVTWMISSRDGSVTGIYEQRYSAAGAKVSVETKVNTYAPGEQADPAVAALADGGWVVTWDSGGPDDSLGVCQQRYAASGARIGVENQVNTTTTGDQNDSAIAVLADNGWVVTWNSRDQDGSGFGVYQQRYTASGGRIGVENQVNTTTTGDQLFPAVAALVDGGWIVTWGGNGQPGSAFGVYQQLYAASGAKKGIETPVSMMTDVEPNSIVITALADGGWVVAWHSGSDLYQQRYDTVGNPVGG